MRKKNEDHFVGGPWPHQMGGYEICYFKNGKKRSEYRKDKREAELRCEYWRTTLAPGKPKSDEEEHPVHYWGRVLKESAELLIKHPEDRAIAAAARALASLASEGLKTAKYLPPPPQKDAAEEIDLAGQNLDKMTSAELAKLLESKE